MSINPQTGLTDNGIMSETKRPLPPRIIIVPDHLKPFWRVYNTLLKGGFFEDSYKVFEENKDKIPEIVADYAKQLLILIVAEKNLDKKYGYYQAFSKLVDYLGGKLGKNPHTI